MSLAFFTLSISPLFLLGGFLVKVITRSFFKIPLRIFRT